MINKDDTISPVFNDDFVGEQELNRLPIWAELKDKVKDL